MGTPVSTVASAVLRLADVRVARASFEASLGCGLDRFEPDPCGNGCYAQIALPEDCDWAAVIVLFEKVGPALAEHVRRGEVAQPILDVAFFLEPERLSASLRVPSAVAAALARWGIDLEATVYVSSGE